MACSARARALLSALALTPLTGCALGITRRAGSSPPTSRRRDASSSPIERTAFAPLRPLPLSASHLTSRRPARRTSRSRMPSTAASSPPRPSPPPPPPPPGPPGRASRSAQAPWKRRRRQLATAHVRAGTASARASSAPSRSGRRGATSRSGMSYRSPAAAPPPPSPRRSRLPAQSWRGRSHARRSGAASRRVRRRASCAPRACSSTTPPRRQPSRRRERA